MTEPDDLEPLLAPPGASGSAALQEAIRLQTVMTLRRGRWVRRLANGGAVAALFAAGVFAGRESKPERIVDLRDYQENARVVETAPPAIPPAVIEPQTPGFDESLPAPRLELQAEQAEDRFEAGRIYRLAGDRYLDGHDYPNAARCYRLFLARAGDAALQPDLSDNWLLTSMKNAASQEKTHVAKNGG